MSKHTILSALLLTLASCVFSGGLAALESAGSNLTVGGEAKQVCRLPAPTVGQTSNAGFASSTINITKLLDDTNATVKASSITLTYPSALCNYNAIISLATANGGLVTQSPGAPGFLNKVDYVIQGTWGGVTLPMLDTTGKTPNSYVSADAGGAAVGDLVLNITMPDGTMPVVAGQFSDIITVKIGAAY